MLAIQARTIRDIAEAELGRLVGAPPGTAIQTTSALVAPDRVDLPVPALIEQARAGRDDRAALVKRVTAAEERRQAATAGGKPTIAVGGGVDYARPNPRIFPREAAWRESWDASVNMTWSIFDGGRTRAEIGGAVATRRAAEERLAEFDSILAVEVRQRVGELESSRAAIAAADDAVRSASEARRVVSDRFTAGVTTSSEVLDAQVALLQAGLDRTQTIASARLAEARLNRALGREP
jgi:outer membrane protein TolC